MFYRAIRVVFRCIALPYFRFRVTGAEGIPSTGPAVVVAVHRSWLDPAAVGGALGRPVRFLILERVYRKPWARWFYRGMGGIPVPDGRRGAALSLRAALKRLQAGEIVGIFPEGGVKPEGIPETIFPGAAMLSVKAGAPIIPVRIRGSAEAWPRGSRLPRPMRVTVEIGNPIEPPRGEPQAATDEMMRRIELALREASDPGHGESPRGAAPKESAWTPR